jgi:hypothetical protein
MILSGTLKMMDEWTCNHFIHCILEGQRRAKIKPLNYSQVMAVQQGPLKTPVAFLQRLKDALQRHTNFVPESQKEIVPKEISNKVSLRYL